MAAGQTGEAVTMRTIRTAKNEEAFLEALRACGSVTSACEHAGIGRTAVYAWRDEDEAFAKAWSAAQEIGTDGLEDEALRRAYEGTTRPVFYEGVECGRIREYSDTLMIFMLKARRPEKFKDRAQLSGDPNAPLQLGYVVIPGKAQGEAQ